MLDPVAVALKFGFLAVLYLFLLWTVRSVLKSGAAYDLSQGALLGRGDQADIVLEDSFASTRHARLVPHGDVIVLEDLGSTNGTYLNDEPLRGPQPLHPGDRVRIGDSVFTFER